MKFPNRVREVRMQRGLSREHLAKAAGITRQSVGLIEAGKVSPNTVTALRLASALGETVETLFADPETSVDAYWSSAASPSPAATPQRAYLAAIDGRWVARPALADTVPPAAPVHGVVQTIDTERRQARLSLLAPLAEARKTVFISGCDPALGLLGEYTRVVARGHRGVWFNVSNRQAVVELAAGTTHVAAAHVPDEPALWQSVREALAIPSAAGQSVEWLSELRPIRLAGAELGWVMRSDVRPGFAGAASLRQQRWRLVNREPGSGARAVLDAELARAEVAPQQVNGYHTVVHSHLAVAAAVRDNLADVGVAHAAAARFFGLAFTPIQEEVCFLLIHPRHIQTDAVQALLEALQSDKFRSELSAFGPYDVTGLGTGLTTEEKQR
ncbi:substrate-binding domain-containing protein [Alicyclobacillus shizuokensis]|uniref:substrate-binding domain-containing protein n=1 Tax=Alicyclobacillus shizuokensis TaxID=392014 RepID=UPI00082EB7C6|nr:substrate-binding domain-containing protein [Alicyclobacillus shizuokensis]MCL6626892.1 helix-turn-helix domain-containing protein [Alicyclobacillus shizuokensis]